MRFGSVCSGIEAATVASQPLGWEPAWFSEIEPFPSAVLAHHYPGVPNLGDMTKLPQEILAGAVEAPDLLSGGTPCQAFSVAGLRKGLTDDRGQLTISFCELADAIDTVRARRGEEPCVVFWENVPGVLSDKTNAFGCFLGLLAGEDDALVPPGKRWSNSGCVFGPKRTVAWRTLDAQYFGVAQRRRRVFVVASDSDGPDPCEILFEREGMRRDSAPSREAGEGIAADVAPCLGASGRGVERAEEARGQDPVVAVGVDFQNTAVTGEITGTIRGEAEYHGGHAALGVCVTGEKTHALTGEGHDASEDGTGRGTPIIGFPAEMSGTQVAVAEDRSPALSVKHTIAVAFDPGQSDADGETVEQCPTLRAVPGAMYVDQELNGREEVAGTLQRKGQGGFTGTVCFQQNTRDEVRLMGAIHTDMQVRRLTPTECERLQGFPDGYTANIPHKPVAASGQDKARRLMLQGDPKFVEIDGVIWKVGHADGPRYKALGNSWAVPCVRWIFERIEDSRP